LHTETASQNIGNGAAKSCEGTNCHLTAEFEKDATKQNGQIVDPSVLQIHAAATHAFNLYATMADAVEDTYFQVGASLPT
jgi:hypothetical protein